MIQDLYHGVISIYYKLCLASVSIKPCFINTPNGIEHPVIVNSKKRGGRKKAFFSKTKKDRKEEDYL